MGSNTPSHRRRHDGRIKRAMKIRIAHEFMMCGRMVFREVICNVGSPRGPVKIELLLSNAIFEPMITHVKGFRSFHADLGTENAISSGIVSLKWSGRLWMPHFGESSTHGNGLLSIEKETAGFSLRSRGSNCANSSAKNMDGTIKLGSGRRAGCTREIGKEEIASSTTTGIWERKIGSIGADSKDHVAGVITDGGIGMRGEIVQEHVAGLSGMFGWRILTVGDFIEGNNDSGIAAP